MNSITDPHGIAGIVGGITLLAIIYAVISSSNTTGIINALGGSYSSALSAAKG